MTIAGRGAPGTHRTTDGFFAEPLRDSYTLMRGRVIAARSAELTLPSHPARLSSSVRVTCAAISRLTRGRFGDSHDELLYVIRKPQDRFARVV
jgi:hypothetical protein